MSKLRLGPQVQHLTNSLIADLVAMSDDEVATELAEQGGVDQVLEIARADLEAVRSRMGRRRLTEARRAIDAEKDGLRWRNTLEAAAGRQRLARGLGRAFGSSGRITLAARSGHDIPDEDVGGLLEDAVELGMMPSGDVEE